MADKTLSLRALNRATLARQKLLSRERAPVLRTIEALAGMQAQVPKPPFIGLWSRLEDFRRDDLIALARTRKVVRATMMRGTIHLATAKDYLRLRRTLQPALTRAMQSIADAKKATLEIDRLIALGGDFFRAPHTFDALRDFLEKKRVKCDVRAAAYAVRMMVPLVQVPADDARWGWPAMANFTLAESWLDAPVDEKEDLRELVSRHLAAFGPATAADVQAWSGLRNRAPVVDAIESMRDRLVTFRDERGRTLFDLRDAPRPDEDTPAPPRLLPDYDNVLLAHVDRTRILHDAHKKSIFLPGLRVLASFLVDGFSAGTWSIERTKKAATIRLSPLVALKRDVKRALSEEAEKLVRFLEDDAQSFDVHVAAR